MGTLRSNVGTQNACHQFVTICSQERNEGAVTLDSCDERICCPACSADTYYRYGKTRQGKQKYLCLMCGRQFTPGRKREEIRERPACPSCQSPMHAYKRETGSIRFRCSSYPKCRTFLSIKF
ncbi:MAG: IS1 family transposase [Syntrophobacteraceae bacterium]